MLFFANGFGDNLINLPALRALASAFEGRLRLACSRGPHVVLFDDLPLAERVELPMWREDGRRCFDAAAAAEALGPCDLFVSLVPWRTPSSDALLAALQPATSIGFFDSFDVHVPLCYAKHSAELALDVARVVLPAAALAAFGEPPRYPREAVERARSILALLPRDARAVLVHADTVAEKTWPLERFAAALDAHLSAHPNDVALVVGATVPPFERCVSSTRLASCAGLPFATACALVANADLFVGVDSLMLHVADFARVPSVALFGPTEPREFGCLFAPHTVVRGANGTTSSISVEAVVAALEEMSRPPLSAGPRPTAPVLRAPRSRPPADARAARETVR